VIATYSPEPEVSAPERTAQCGRGRVKGSIADFGIESLRLATKSFRDNQSRRFQTSNLLHEFVNSRLS
jgi:hypothetical protein